jgi:hypothetical protein
MLRNLFGSHVPSYLLFLEDAQSMHITTNILVQWQHAALIFDNLMLVLVKQKIFLNMKSFMLQFSHVSMAFLTRPWYHSSKVKLNEFLLISSDSTLIGVEFVWILHEIFVFLYRCRHDADNEHDEALPRTISRRL